MDKVDPKTWLKDHELAELVNELTKTAREFHDHQSLRNRLRSIVLKRLAIGTDNDSCFKSNDS